MITADDVRACATRAGIADLFRRLGYPVAPVRIESEECGRAGIRTPWNGNAEIYLLARSRRLDVLLVEGAVDDESVRIFINDYSAHNVLTKNIVAINKHQSDTLSIFGLSERKSLLRLDVRIGQPSRHALDRLNLMSLHGADDRAAGRIIDRALDRAAVTRQFFVRFRTALGRVTAALAAALASAGADEVRNEALLILSRLLFLSFIQEKGWLNGERRFLIDRVERCVAHDCDFFSTVLLPLFFGCLNTPVLDRAVDLGAIPYLNGGLFEPSTFERRHPELHVPNDVMSDVLENVFERFDFTVDEGDTAGTRVDPEMLGRVFESLMAADERAASGSFYSPKEIVDALTAGAIVEWLAGGEPAVRDDLAAVCCGGAPTPRLRAASASVLERLHSITVLDPACGSGAFLLSALDVIERITRALSPERPAALRQQIVERSLYGVDVKPEAVRLCELRLWLAIVSTDDATVENVRPLPNLDRNVLQGNSLLGPLDFLAAGRGGVYREWAYGLRAQRDLIARYRTARRDERPALSRLIRENDRRLATDLLTQAVEDDEKELARVVAPARDLFGDAAAVDEQRCRELQDRIAANRETLEDVDEGRLDFFSFDVHFAHVLAGGGFDVVAGNPPWVRHERIDRISRRQYRERYALFRGSRGTAAVHQPDLSIAFVEKAVLLTAPGGIVSMLLPAKIANAAYASRLRRFVREELTIVAITDWTGERRNLFDADTFPLGLTVQRRRPGPDQRVTIAASGSTFATLQSGLEVARADAAWRLVPPPIAAILERLRSRFAPLEETLARRPLMGVKTGDNKRFFLEGSISRGKLVTTDSIAIPLDAVCRCVRGRNVRRWSCQESEWMLWPPRGGWRDLPSWLQQLAVRRGAEPAAFRLSFVRPEHVGVKVAWKDVSRAMAAAVLPDVVHISGRAFPLVPNQTLYSIDCASLDEAYVIAAMLNSVVAGALLLETAERAKDDHFRYFGSLVAALPLPRVHDRPGFQSLLRLSRSAHRFGRAPEELEEVVAGLYEVTGRELSLLREWSERKVGAR
ncbi:MAG TPA: N-6 DNA methylase [Thermoanaerobaculia bacterium]|nr:N-6 DNA methylase [Thermoanaerobaculia bacterium]